uniref:Peroxiredoxin, Prx4 n=1 Tax=Schistosoma mansoni TaxID=6183 RepID=A0A5K4EGD2_SCHMA
MTKDEISLLIANFSRSVTPGSTYHAMLVKLNQILTKNLYNSVEHYMTLKQPTSVPNIETHGEAFLWKQWDQGYSDRYFKLTPSAYPSKSDFITMEANEALIALFEKHPEFLNKLSSRYFNQTFQSSHIRRKLWSIILLSRCKSQGTKFEQIIQTFSPDQDEHILVECRTFLNSCISMSSIKDSVGCLYAMNYLLKFYQMIMNTNENIRLHYIKIASILVLAMKDYLSKNQPPNVETIGVLSQEFFVLLSILPSFITQLPAIWFTHQSLQNVIQHENYRIKGTFEMNDNQKIKFSQSVLKQLRYIDGNIASSVVKQVLFVKDIDTISNLANEEDICSEIFYTFIEPIITSVFIDYLSQSTLLYIWDQLMLCIVGAEPIESSLSYILSCFTAIFIFLCWIRIPSHPMSDINQYEQINTISERKEISRKEIASLNEQFLIIGPELEKDDFQFLIKKYFIMDIFCLLTGTQQYNANSCLLSNDELLTSTGWSSTLQKSYLIDPSKRKEQRLLHYAELERLRNTEDHLMKMQHQLDTYKTKLKEASDEISNSKRLLSQYATKQDYSPNKVDELNDHKMNSSSLNKIKWKSNLHKLTLLKNVAQNFGANTENSNPLKQSQVIQTEND